MVEHNLRVALSLANRVYLMGKAYIGFNGTAQQLKDNDTVRQKYLEV
jgi:branched-chain amino acid transport system ATP-binding protein